VVVDQHHVDTGRAGGGSLVSEVLVGATRAERVGRHDQRHGAMVAHNLVSAPTVLRRKVAGVPSLVTPALPVGTLASQQQPEIHAEGLVLRPWRAEDHATVLAAYAD